jgi:hypothetical protein
MAHPDENTFAGSCPDTATAMKPRDTSETTDTILGGALTIAQPANGYRFSMDSILLARFADVRPRDRALELGAGCGVISILIAAARHPKEIVALERQPHLAELVARNAALNHCANLAVTTADYAAVRFPASSRVPSTRSLRIRLIALCMRAAPARSARGGRLVPSIPRRLPISSARPTGTARREGASRSCLLPRGWRN